MTNVDRVSVLSTALHALSIRQEDNPRAQNVAAMLVDACKKLTEEKAIIPVDSQAS